MFSLCSTTSSLNRFVFVSFYMFYSFTFSILLCTFTVKNNVFPNYHHPNQILSFLNFYFPIYKINILFMGCSKTPNTLFA